MDQGTSKAINFLSKAELGGILGNSPVINALGCILMSTDPQTQTIAKQIMESISSSCKKLLNESTNFAPQKPVERPEDKYAESVRNRASDLCW